MLSIGSEDVKFMAEGGFYLSDNVNIEAARSYLEDDGNIGVEEILDENEILPKNSESITNLSKKLLEYCGSGNVNGIKALMAKGVPLTADVLGTGPLHAAATSNCVDVCQILLRAGISRDARTKFERTALHIAATSGHYEIVELLLKSGADYDCQDMLFMTPLHWAAQKGHADIAALLIRYGATTQICNKFELTPYDIALQISRQDIADIIQTGVRDPLIATQHLQLEMATDSNERYEAGQMTEDQMMISDGTVLMEDVNSDTSMDPDRIITELEPQQEPVVNGENIQQPTMSESMKFLEEHGITLLPNEPNNILNVVMDAGHSVVLSDLGKQMLNSVTKSETVNIPPPKEVPIVVPKSPQLTISKPVTITQKVTSPITKKKILKITKEQFLAMAKNGQLTNVVSPQGKLVQVLKNSNISKLNNLIVKRIQKPVKKSKGVPILTKLTGVQTIGDSTDIESMERRLAQAKQQIQLYERQIQEYEVLMFEKNREIEALRTQVTLLTEQVIE